MVELYHDVTDIFMELAKVCVYFKIRGGKFDPKFERLADILFAIFTVVW